MLADHYDTNKVHELLIIEQPLYLETTLDLWPQRGIPITQDLCNGPNRGCVCANKRYGLDKSDSFFLMATTRTCLKQWIRLITFLMPFVLAHPYSLFQLPGLSTEFVWFEVDTDVKGQALVLQNALLKSCRNSTRTVPILPISQARRRKT